MPIMRYFCSLPSRANMNVQMRVTSAWNASTIRSHIRRKCSDRSAGTPCGRAASSGACAGGSVSARAIRCSNSRTQDRYWSSLCRSAPPSWFSRLRASCNTSSSTLARSRLRFARSGSFGLVENSRSNTSLGSTSFGSGVVALRQASVCS